MAKKTKAAGQPPTRSVAAGTRELFSVQVSSDGALLVTGGWDRSRTWDFQTGAAVRHYEATPSRGAVNWQTAMSADGKRVVAGYGDLSLAFYEGSSFVP